MTEPSIAAMIGFGKRSMTSINSCNSETTSCHCSNGSFSLAMVAHCVRSTPEQKTEPVDVKMIARTDFSR